MARDIVRVKRGMVFTYNINPDVDKRNPPKVIGARGKEYDNHLQYGWRTYVVVSNDIANTNSDICSIVPMTTHIDRIDIPTHVTFMNQEIQLQILCEHIYTINSAELTRYEYVLGDEIMDKVDRALAVQLNLSYDKNPVAESLEDIEDIINSIIEKKVAEITAKSEKIDITDTISRIGDKLQSILVEESKSDKIVEDSVVSKPKERISPIDKFYKRYPQLAPSEEDSSQKTRRKWTIESMQEFLEDSKRLSPEAMVEHYKFKSISDYSKTKYYVIHRLEGEEKNGCRNRGED